MTRDLRILHMHFGTDGGAERFFVNLVQGFGERGAEQHFVTRPNRDWLADIRPLGPVWESNFRLASPAALILRARLWALRRDWQPDAIFAWMSRASKLLPRGGQALRVTRLGDYPRHLKNFANNDLIIANTPGIEQACRDLGWSRPVVTISNFARQITPAPVARAAYDTPQDAFLVMGSGRFIRRKGFDTLIRAVARLPDAWLWLAGAGELEPDLRALADQCGLGGRIRFLGWMEEPMHAVAASDVYVMPSRHEPLGNVILESWACGVPVVATRSEGPQWFCSDGQDALLVEIDDVAAMSDAIARLRADRALAQHLIAGGRETLAARFTRARVIDQYLDAIAQYRDKRG